MRRLKTLKKLSRATPPAPLQSTPPELQSRNARRGSREYGNDRRGSRGRERPPPCRRRDEKNANTRLLLLDRLRPEQGGTQRRLRRSGWFLGCRGRRLRSYNFRSFSSLDLVLSSSFFNTRRQEGFKRSGLAVEAEPHDRVHDVATGHDPPTCVCQNVMTRRRRDSCPSEKAIRTT